MTEADIARHHLAKLHSLNGVAEQFRAYALSMVDADYDAGSENLIAADCSGTVCYPLMRLGYRIRTTADGLYRDVFTMPVEGSVQETDYDRVMAVFYVTRAAVERWGRTLPAGTARHVTPVVGEYVVVDADGRADVDRVVLRTAASVRRRYEAIGCYAVWRQIDWEVARRIDAAGTHIWGVDTEIRSLLDG